MRLFNAWGKKKEETPREAKIAHSLEQVKQTIEVLSKQETHYNVQLQMHHQAAEQKLRAGDKQGALMALRRKQNSQKMLAQNQNQVAVLERQMFSLNAAQTAKVVTDALESSIAAQRQLQSDPARVDALLENLEEQQQRQDEVNHLMSLGVTSYDDEALLRELDDITAIQAVENLPLIPTVPISVSAVSSRLQSTNPFPAPVSHAMVAPQMPSSFSSDDAQLRELEAELG
eukprot:GHVN01077864.1.p1 GENE.GHVN01077864.1~~GHVN01077864.1.p1  ORF type:complete len:230 (+),score=35.52 GHVN01077864.1:274-963(+)